MNFEWIAAFACISLDGHKDATDRWTVSSFPRWFSKCRVLVLCYIQGRISKLESFLLSFKAVMTFKCAIRVEKETTGISVKVEFAIEVEANEDNASKN
jgi:hypothetical protein